MDNIKIRRPHDRRQAHSRPVSSARPRPVHIPNASRHSGKKYWLIRSIGRTAARTKQTAWQRFKKSEFARWPFKSIFTRAYALVVALVFLTSTVAAVVEPFIRERPHKISEVARTILPKTNAEFGALLTENLEEQKYVYNEGYTFQDSLGSNSNRPRFTAEFSTKPKEGVQITDSANNINFGLKPKFGLTPAKKDENRIIYQLTDYDGYVVYTSRTASVKEDILLETYDKDRIEFAFELELTNGLEARLEQNGALGIYGSDLPINGNVSTGSEADAALLEKARQNSQKNKLIFTIPAPVVLEANQKQSAATSRFELEGNTLTIITNNLLNANYPLSIDPTVYIETAAKLMRGNNETNTDFDIENELIQKSQTTGARINAWEQNLDMSQAAWGVGTAAAGGYVYRTGGQTGASKPQIVGQQETLLGTNSTSFQMSMPAVRPAGDLYVALFCKDQNAGRTVTTDAPGGSGWTEFADTGEFSAYYKVGTNVSGGNEAASYSFSASASEMFAGVIVRVTNFNTTTPVSPTPTTNNSGASNNQPVFPAITPDNDATLIIRAAGADNDNPSSTGWVPSGHTKIGSAQSSTANGRCAYAAASLDASPASGVSTGTATYADTTITDQWGSATIAINPTSYTIGTQNEVSWAKFNSTTLALESPNPGTGACSGWCNNSAYALPAARRGHSTVAYNGYLYVIGGLDGSGNRTSTVYIAKLGANGEPMLWHPTGGTPAYWYSDTGLSSGTARSYTAAAAYNNRMYLVGGQTNAATGGVTTVEYADINPNGRLGTWNAGNSLPAGAGRHMHTIHVYNDVLYTIGGFEGAQTSTANLRNTVYYARLNSNGSLNTWIQTESFSGGRATYGGAYSAVWGAYIYLAGGCTAVNASGYCTTVNSQTQLASINADGTIAPWNEILNLANQRVGYSLMAWQGGLYRFGGCTYQNVTTGNCEGTLADVDYGVINPDGDASTVNNSEPSGTAPCSGGSPTNCDLPPVGDNAGQGGQMSSMAVINNGFIYNIGGCVDGSSACDTNMSGNISYSAISTTGALVSPTTCPGTLYGHWCVDSTNRINGTAGLGAAGATVFNNVIYVAGGTNSAAWQSNVWRVGLNTNGSLTGAWASQTLTSLGLGGTADDARGYMYMFTRANPNSITNPGNLYMLGGCSGAAGIGCSTYHTDVIKCNIATAGSLNTCTTTGQLQIDADNVTAGSQGLGLMAGTIYANRIYLVGGSCPNAGTGTAPCGPTYSANRKDTIYAVIDANNNIVAQSGGAWTFASAQMDPVRRRAVSFGYNGYVYSLAGYSGSESLQDLLFSRIDVSTGDMGPWNSSGVVVTPRWDLRAAVSNGYVYAIGGCATGAAPSNCAAMQPEVQTFQLYNNDSGAVNNFTAQSDQTFTTATDRWGASSAILNGYLYVAGGCTSATDCTTTTASVEHAPISADDGSIGTWAASGSLPFARAWGSLQAVGNSLYYIGGQDNAGAASTQIYNSTSIVSGVVAFALATSALPQARKQFAAAVWNDRIYVVGGYDGSNAVTNTVYVGPQQTGGGLMTGSWSSSTGFTVARAGMAVTAYANNLYLFGGYDGTNYLSDSQFTQINSDGTVDAWTQSTSLPTPLSNSTAVSANGYIYLIGGRSAAASCSPKVIITPISANTTIATGNNPTGIGEWYETNVRYAGDRYGAAVAYDKGKIYTMGGGCTAPLATNRHYYSTVKSQPQVAIYSRMIDTDTDVFPNSWLMNGIDNSIGARWQVKYRSMNDTDGIASDCGTADMSTWGQDFNFGDTTLGTVNTYTPRDGSGNNINCARYFYFYVSIDASKTFGYPEDVNRGPTIADLSLFFTSDPSKRLRHGKTFTGGEQQPLDTPCRQSGGQPNCPLP